MRAATAPRLETSLAAVVAAAVAVAAAATPISAALPVIASPIFVIAGAKLPGPAASSTRAP